jgi:hypothetical protein
LRKQVIDHFPLIICKSIFVVSQDCFQIIPFSSVK